MGGFISLSVSHPLVCIPRSESGTRKWGWENKGVVSAPLDHGVVAPVREQKKTWVGVFILLCQVVVTCNEMTIES